MIIKGSRKFFKKIAEKAIQIHERAKFHENQQSNRLYLVLVHHLRFFGMKRSLEHQDGAKDKGMT